jgi:hypothetical protein
VPRLEDGSCRTHRHLHWSKIKLHHLIRPLLTTQALTSSVFPPMGRKDDQCWAIAHLSLPSRIRHATKDISDLGLCFRMPTRLAVGFGPEAGPTRRRGAIHPSEANSASLDRGAVVPPRLDPPSPGHSTGTVRRYIGFRLVTDTSMCIRLLYPELASKHHRLGTNNLRNTWQHCRITVICSHSFHA